VFGIGQTDMNTLVDGYRKASAMGTAPLLLALAVIGAPLFEEIVFRGFVYRGWSQTRLGVVATIVISSILFGLMHVEYTWVGMLDTMVFGLIAGWARWRSGTLVLPILLHAANNLIVMFYIVSQASAPLVVTGL
jgi:membrane protease YdiL (CAAX protease family)